MTFFYRHSLFLLPFALLGGCAGPEPVIQRNAPDAVIQRIDAAIVGGSVQKPIGFETSVPKPVYGQENTSVSFAGDATQLLLDAARNSKLTFLLTGPQPRLPIFVQIDVKGVTFESFLRQVAVQLGQRADIELTESSIELKYR